MRFLCGLVLFFGGLTVICGLVVFFIGLLPGGEKKKEFLLGSLAAIGIGILLVIPGRIGYKHFDERANTKIRISGPEEVAKKFVKGKGDAALVDPQILGTDKKQAFKDWEKRMLSGTYALLGKRFQEKRYAAETIEDLKIVHSAVLSETPETATVEIRGTMEPHLFMSKTDYIFQKQDFTQLVYLIKRGQQWYVTDFK